MRSLVAERRQLDPAPDDPFRGLYLSDDAVARLLVGDGPETVLLDRSALDRIEDEATAAAADGNDVRLRRLSDAGCD